MICFVCFWRKAPNPPPHPGGGMASSFTRFLDRTQRRTTVGRTSLDELSARRRDLYLTTHNTHNRQTSMPPVGFEPTISAGERPQTYALDRAATGTGASWFVLFVFVATAPQWARVSSFTRFLDQTQRRTTFGRASLDEWSARRTDFYLTTHNTHNRLPCPRWDSNPQSQQASGRRPKPRTARPLGPALHDLWFPLNIIRMVK